MQAALRALRQREMDTTNPTTTAATHFTVLMTLNHETAPMEAVQPQPGSQRQADKKADLGRRTEIFIVRRVISSTSGFEVKKVAPVPLPGHPR